MFSTDIALRVEVLPGNHSRGKWACALQVVDSAPDTNHSFYAINVHSTSFNISLAMLFT